VDVAQPAEAMRGAERQGTRHQLSGRWGFVRTQQLMIEFADGLDCLLEVLNSYSTRLREFIHRRMASNSPSQGPVPAIWSAAKRGGRLVRSRLSTLKRRLAEMPLRRATSDLRARRWRFFYKPHLLAGRPPPPPLNIAKSLTGMFVTAGAPSFVMVLVIAFTAYFHRELPAAAQARRR
jgi:hypothetical protein